MTRASPWRTPFAHRTYAAYATAAGWSRARAVTWTRGTTGA